MRKIFEEGKYFSVEEKEKEGNIWRRSLKDIEKSRFQSRSQSRDFCQFLEGFGFGFGEFGLRKKSRFRFRKIWSREKSLGFGKIWSRKKVSVSVSENLVSEEKYRFRFRKNLVSEKSLGFGFGKFGIVKKVSVSVSVKILVSSFSAVNQKMPTRRGTSPTPLKRKTISKKMLSLV